MSLCQNCFSKLTIMSVDFPKSNILDRLKPNYISQIFIAYQFDEVIQSVIHHMKYQKKPNLGIVCGSHSSEILKEHFNHIQHKYYLPVPLHPIRQKERGYNQSEFICKGFIKNYHGALLNNVISRGKHTISQTNLNRKERQQNVHQAFHIKDGVDISGKTIILVDDLITTGATMNECARVLKENGAQGIIGVAVASPVNHNN